MKSLVVNQLGSLDDLHVQETPSPVLADGQVRIKVAACGLNFVDSLLVEGRYQVKPAVPFVPGSEITGRIVETGPGVDASMIGRRVFAPVPNGGFADEVVTAANRILPIPDALSDGQGATFMQSYLTAWFAFTRRTQVQAGKTMLVLGAGGGIGLAAVDAGVALGLRVIAAASSEEKRQLALDRGAFATVDVLNDDVKARVREARGRRRRHRVRPGRRRPRGTVPPCAERRRRVHGRRFRGGNPAPAGELRAAPQPHRRRRGLGAWVGRNQGENQKMLIEVMGRIVDGSLRPVEPVAYPMSRAVEAMRDLQNRKVAGKVALVPDFA